MMTHHRLNISSKIWEGNAYAIISTMQSYTAFVEFHRRKYVTYSCV